MSAYRLFTLALGLLLTALAGRLSFAQQPILFGQFLDSPVSGLTYVSGSQSGLTDIEGTFSYEQSMLIQFSIGGIVLGEAVAQKAITPVDLVPDATDEMHPTVTNIARFLLTLDDDADPATGITITQSVRDVAAGHFLDFNREIIDFESDASNQTLIAQLTGATTAGTRPLVSPEDAQLHLAETLLELYAGQYNGTFSGTDSGVWTAELDEFGNVSGSGTSARVGEFSVRGFLRSSGELTFFTRDVNTGATFSGNIRQDNVSGVWQNELSGDNGTFAGQKSSDLFEPPPTSPSMNISILNFPIPLAVYFSK